MTVLLNNNFDGGVTGSQITTSNSGVNPADSAFTYVGQLNGGACQYADVAANSLNRDTAEYVMSMTSGSTTGAEAYVGYNATSLGSLVTYWTRFYVYFSSLTTNAKDTNLHSAYHTSGIPGVALFLYCRVAPFQLYIWNGNQSNYVQMTTGLAAGVWNRIEFTATMSAGSSGTATLNLYTDPNADGTTPTETVSLSGQNFGTSSINSASLGMDYDYQTNTPTVYFSNWQINNYGYPGPAPYRPGAGCPGVQPNAIAIHTDCS